ncbi:MAG TPA: hypothetical protein VK465_15065 [Fibrobacteria bacterium]|nr:hypothetical protein [Fibrobacteria bacterium]
MRPDASLTALATMVSLTLLSLLSPAGAVVRYDPLDSPPDTLVLQPREARDFRLRRLAGSDLHHAGLYLGIAAAPLILATPWLSDRLGVESPVGGLEESFFFLTYGALPAFAAVMAAGNLVYASAARYHPERDFALSGSPAPLAALSFAAAKVFYLATQGDLAETHGVGRGLVMAFAFSELLTMPLMRSQFSAASAFLEQVRIRVTGAGPGVDIRAQF